MFRDTQAELQRLAAELLSEEDATVAEQEALDGEETCSSSDRVACQSFSYAYGKKPRNRVNGYKAYNTDKTDTSPETYSQALLSPKKGIGGLIFLAVILTLCIAAVVIYWLVRYWGIL